MVEVAGEVADAGVGYLAPGSAQPCPIGLSGDLGRGAGGLAVEDRGDLTPLSSDISFDDASAA
nr:hypothetical protein [Streptomyces sasae]